jgi:ATPase subunit of ABC transporter with duplicated ATPase domains
MRVRWRLCPGRPDVLLMDEPTNHLDIESIIWLEQFLKSFLSPSHDSHDRESANRIVSRIAEIDGGEIIAYTGDYDFTSATRRSRQTSRRPRRQQSMLWEQRFIERPKTRAAAAQVQADWALDKIEKIDRREGRS